MNSFYLRLSKSTYVPEELEGTTGLIGSCRGCGELKSLNLKGGVSDHRFSNNNECFGSGRVPRILHFRCRRCRKTNSGLVYDHQVKDGYVLHFRVSFTVELSCCIPVPSSFNKTGGLIYAVVNTRGLMLKYRLTGQDNWTMLHDK